MNEINQIYKEIKNLEHIYSKKLKTEIQNRVDMIEPSIKVDVYCNQLNTILVIFKEYRFNFHIFYGYKNDNDFYIRGTGKTQGGYGYWRNGKTSEEIRSAEKKRADAYNYVRNVLIKALS